MRVRVEVTQNDIRKGRRGDCANCPIARAVKRVTRVQNALVEDDGTISFSKRDNIVIIPASEKRERFISKFDAGEKVEPIVFLMNIPKSVLS